MNALRCLHSLCRVPDFKQLCLDEHKFTTTTFDNYIKEVNLLLKDSLKIKEGQTQEDWNVFVNCCASSVAFVDCFPERSAEFQPMILDLINVIKEKTELVRKNAAILLAKLAVNEDNNKFIRANHGFDVLMSLRNQFK